MKITKNNDVMAFLYLEDLYGEIMAIAFPKTYAQYKATLFQDNIVKLEGRVNIREDEITIAATKIETLTARESEYLLSARDKKKLTINIPQNLSEEELKKLEADLKYNEGFLQSVLKKLSNEKFVSKAPANVIEMERKKQADAESKIASLKESIAALKK